MKKSKRDPKVKPRGAARSKDYRFFVLAGVFFALMAAFSVVFAVNQIKGTSGRFTDDGLTVRIETVAGERGRIYDRNGKLLVGNAAHYDLIFEYGSMPDRRPEVNAALLECIEALEVTGNADKRAKDFFPLVGSYPSFKFSTELLDPDSDVTYYYARFLDKNGLDEKIGLSALTEYFTDKYSLDEKLYSDGEISELIRIYYEMDRIGFGYYQPCTLATGIEPENEADMALITYIEEHHTEGATLMKSTERVYTYEGYATHILGTIGKITAENIEDYADYPLDALVGISGCENVFEEYLRGSNGKRISKYNAEGELVERYYDPEPVVGNDIYLTIDIELQMIAEDALREEIDALPYSETGAITAIDPDSGEAIVIASYSTESSLNFALQGTFAPGSTFKVGSALAALEEGYINENTCYTCNHVYPHLGGPTCLGNHGVTDVSKAIEVSCNIFFYYLGHNWGLENITEYTRRLGLGVSSGIELGERVGIIASEGYCDEHDLEWSEFDDATGAIGQSKHAYTPLQLSVYMSTIVNGGTRYSAHILQSIKTRSGEVVYKTETSVLDRVSISEENHALLMDAMGSVVSSSSTLSSHFGDVGVEVGGKTGTAETGKEISNALFAGFAPAAKPEIVVSCVLEEGDAGTNAAKVTAKVFEAYFAEDEAEDILP